MKTALTFQEDWPQGFTLLPYKETDQGAQPPLLNEMMCLSFSYKGPNGWDFVVMMLLSERVAPQPALQSLWGGGELTLWDARMDHSVGFGSHTAVVLLIRRTIM